MVLPLEPVILLTGSGRASLRFDWKAGMAEPVPGLVGLRRLAEGPSVPVTCLPRFQSSPVIVSPPVSPSPVMRDLG